METKLKYANLIARLKHIASENYEKGGDSFIECYTDQDWTQFIEEANGAPVARLRKAMKRRYDHQKEIENA